MKNSARRDRRRGNFDSRAPLKICRRRRWPSAAGHLSAANREDGFRSAPRRPAIEKSMVWTIPSGDKAKMKPLLASARNFVPVSGLEISALEEGGQTSVDAVLRLGVGARAIDRSKRIVSDARPDLSATPGIVSFATGAELDPEARARPAAARRVCARPWRVAGWAFGAGWHEACCLPIKPVDQRLD